MILQTSITLQNKDKIFLNFSKYKTKNINRIIGAKLNNSECH